MKTIFTGMNGTVAPAVASYFTQQGVEVVPYDREKISTINQDEIEAFIVDQKIDMFLHFAMGSYDWTSMLAIICNKLKIPFVYISTVSVFASDRKGPYTVDMTPDAIDDYGLYKRESERLVLLHNPKSFIIRLGWQIGISKGKNQMIDFLYKQMEEKGFIEASSSWYPSVSFLTDSAKTIYQITQEFTPGIYHVNSNNSFTFYDIASYLKSIYPEFIVNETNDFIADHRMIDDRVSIRTLDEIFDVK